MQTSSSQSLLLTHTPSASSLMLPEKANVVAFREEAIPLITFCPNSQAYEINEEAADIIRQIPQPLGVVTVAGLYRTGKSYLLNRMLLNKSSGFGVGPTVNPCTKGLWVWGAPIRGTTPEGEAINILIIDSEGIGSLGEDQTHDTRVFSLAVLLGSCFIYNSVGSIDENAVQNLSLVVNLTKHIHIRSQSNDEIDSEDYSNYMPTFFWLIRDFSLQIMDNEGEAMSAKEYLEVALQPQKGFSDEVEQKNRIRRLLTSFFKERDCITMVRPVIDEQLLQKLDRLELDSLRPEFLQQVMNLRKRILTQCKAKRVNGRELSGEMFIGLARSYLQAINQGGVPNIENAWKYVCRSECQKAVERGLEVYERQLKELLFPRLPTLAEEVRTLHRQAKEAALEVFARRAVGEEVQREYERELRTRIRQRLAQVTAHNEQLGANVCNQFIAREFASIEKKLKMHEYKYYVEFEKDTKLFFQFLLEHGPKTANRRALFLEFLQRALSEGANYFVKNLQGEIEIQRNCANELQKKGERELRETREELAAERRSAAQRVQQLEREKAELDVQTQRGQQMATELQVQKGRAEEELRAAMAQRQADWAAQGSGLRAKIAELEESLKACERELFVRESAHQKERALLEHKAQHFERLVEEYSQKEKQYDTAIVNTKSDHSQYVREMVTKYESQLKSLQQQLESAQEHIIELQESGERAAKQRDDAEVQYQSQLQQLEKSERLALDSLQALKSQLAAAGSDASARLQDAQVQLQEQLTSAAAENTALKERLREREEELKQSAADGRKHEALLSQKAEFLSAQLEEARSQLADVKKAHDQTLQALELSAAEYGSKLDNRQFLEVQEQHLQQVRELEETLHTRVKAAQAQADIAFKEREEAELQYKMLVATLQNEIAELRDNLQLIERENGQLQVRMKDAEENTKLTSKEVEHKYVQRIAILEQQLQDLREKMQQEQYEQQAKSEEALAQLKNFYELEKERLEARVVEEREKSQKNYVQVMEECEARVREEQTQFEEECESLKEEIREYEIQMSTMQAQFEHELELKSKTAENLEKLLRETKDALAASQASHEKQLEQQLYGWHSERKEMSEKLEHAAQDLQRREKEFLTLSQRKEQLEGTLTRKEELWEATKSELQQERQQLNERLDEMRRKYGELQDEYLEHKINYEKSIALSTQQNEFFGKKVQELEKQLEVSAQRYDERIRSQKQEWSAELNEKLGRLQEEKQSIESKYEALKRQHKEAEQVYQKTVGALERERAVALEKLANWEAKAREWEEKHHSEAELSSRSTTQLRESFAQERKALAAELEGVKRAHQQVDAELHEVSSQYEREKALWEGKVSFLEQQREQSRQELKEMQRKFEATLQQIQKARQSDKHEQENTVSEKLVSIEKKYQAQITELTEHHTQQLADEREKQRRLERELKQFSDKLLLDHQSKNSSQLYTEKRLQELQESEKRLQQELEKSKNEVQSRALEGQKILELARESAKTKVAEMEEKFREAEKKRSTLIFEHEKERAKWNLEKDHLLSQRNDLQESLQKIEKKQEILLRENERLKTDSRVSKRQHAPQLATSFQLNISRGLGGGVSSNLATGAVTPLANSDRKSSPISQRTALNNFNRERNSYNDYSLINNSIDMKQQQQQGSSEDDNLLYGNKENFTGSILDSIKNVAVDAQPSFATGFKNFCQQQQQIQASGQQGPTASAVYAEIVSASFDGSTTPQTASSSFGTGDTQN